MEDFPVPRQLDEVAAFVDKYRALNPPFGGEFTQTYPGMKSACEAAGLGLQGHMEEYISRFGEQGVRGMQSRITALAGDLTDLAYANDATEAKKPSEGFLREFGYRVD